MAKISRHPVDVASARELASLFAEDFPGTVQAARQDLMRCNLLRSDAESYAGNLVIADADSAELCRALRIGAQAMVALFAGAMATGSEVEVTLGEGPPVRVPAKVSKDMPDVGNWLRGFYLAAITRDKDLLDFLCSVPIDFLRASLTKGDEYHYLFADALQGFWRREGDAAQRLLAALEATDPEQVQFDPDYALNIVVPQMELLLRVMDLDAEGFNAALRKALELHKKYWSKATQHRNRDASAYIALGITALAGFAHDANLPVRVESDYLPMKLVQGGCRS